MYEQRMYRRILLMRRVLEKLSYDLSRINITFVQMTNDFVVFVDSQDRLIVVFINVLVNVLNDFYDRAYLHIDVNLVSQRQIRIIRNNSTIIECENAIFEQKNDSRTFVISSFVFRIFVFLDNDEFQERSRIMLETDMIIDRSANHTYFEEICDFARFVSHLFLNDISQNFVTIQDKIRKFRTYDVVDSFQDQKSIFRSQKH
jgi:hypothetical protein